MSDNAYVVPFEQLGIQDVESVGGKNASLGEMISHLSSLGVSVPSGFATTAHAYREFFAENDLSEPIYQLLDHLDVDDVVTLAAVGAKIRRLILSAPFSADFIEQLTSYYQSISATNPQQSFAVRSSATAEDLPDASFAGQQETFLNIQGLSEVQQAIKEVFASLFNDRAIAYRVHQGFDHRGVALSAGIQRMVRSDLASSGVMFTLDTESGFSDSVLITSSYGLGESVVQGAVNPDEFYVYKPALSAGKQSILRRKLGSKMTRMVYSEDPAVGKTIETQPVPAIEADQFSLSDSDATELARQALIIERHYGQPMDIEWAKDGVSGELFIVQARPETVQSRKDTSTYERYTLENKGAILCEGRSIGQRIGAGNVCILKSISDMDQLQVGDVLVTDMTDPDWEPVMKRASAIVTNRGGRTCHAAIIARELGIPAVVGCGKATEQLEIGAPVTVSCAEGDSGYVYAGVLPFEVESKDIEAMPALPFKLMLNVGNPDRAFDFQRLPHAGIGLARLEFIINRMVGVHPKALLNYSDMMPSLQRQIDRRIKGYKNPRDFYVAKVAEGVATLAAAFAPEKVIVRMSDFKSNEYAHLLGGEQFEPLEENPMLGFRGASRYISADFRDCFALECEALKFVRDDMGLTNIELMVPFVRTPDEAKNVIELLAENGLHRGENGLRVIMMCELPANALLADEFLQYFDGFSIGSNDLTQLTLGLDRDSGLVAHLFDERNPAIKALLSMAISACKKAGKYVGICGQGPSDHLDFAVWLMEQGIDSVSLNPDSLIDTWLHLSAASETSK